MISFLFTLQFLTLIPVKIRDISERKIGLSLVYFPLVGLLLGLVLSGIYNLLLIMCLAAFSTDIILVVALAVLTGGLHLDGLADTVDAFSSRKNKEETLKIMRDPHIGALGVISLVSVILLKIALLYSITVAGKVTVLILMCVLSRWSQVLLIFLFTYAHSEGKAKIFMQQVNFKIFLWATLITLALVVFTWQWRGLLIFGVGAISAYSMGRFISHKLGGITGDTLGAINELTEVMILLGINIWGGLRLWMIWR